MSKIKILSPYEAQKIAAGEVVERPAHILKELLENAIDAGASQITVYIQGAGKTCIRIVDNGSGMGYDDIKLSVIAHATSKITTVEDLTSVATYGFRGEALASVAAVSRLTITSRNDELEYAWQVRFEQGDVATELRVAAEQGTDIEVRDLFYNIPARKKFLKQDETEWNQLQQLVHAIALSHLAISFKLYHNDRLVLQSPAVTNLKDRAAQIWGVSTAQQFLPLELSTTGPVQLSGVITSHQVWRYGKHQIFFFVNGRWVKDIELVKSLCKGYNNVLPPGKFPAGVIMLKLDPLTIDVNVHPKKEEVRFTKPQVVTNMVTQAVQATLRAQMATTVDLFKGNDLTIPVEDGPRIGVRDDKEVMNESKSFYSQDAGPQLITADFQDGFDERNFFQIDPSSSSIITPLIPSDCQAIVSRHDPESSTSPSSVHPEEFRYPVHPESAHVLRHAATQLLSMSGSKDSKDMSGQSQSVTRIVVDSPDTMPEWPKRTTPSTFTNLGNVFTQAQPDAEQQQVMQMPTRTPTAAVFSGTLVGQVLNTYLIIDRADGIILVDQHAAHERILYEQMRDRVVAREASLLLFPRVLTLAPEELVALERFEGVLNDFGIACDRMGLQALAIKAVPLGVTQIDLEDLLRQVAALALEHEHVEAEVVQKLLYEHVHSHLACKRAVKAGDVLTRDEMEKLLQDLIIVEKPFICIHGRPTYWKLEKSQLEKFFRR
jgi:DNA mismatch repair protein MutL